MHSSLRTRSIAILCLFLVFCNFNFSMAAAADTAAIDKGKCFVGTAFKATAEACQNEGEQLTDPDDASSLLCSTKRTGRFNLEELNGNTDTTKDRNANCEKDIIFASRCRRSCKTCCILPEFDSCKDKITPCSRLQCVNPVYALTQCPETCGKCIEVIRADKETELCIDTMADCASIKEQGKCGDPTAAKKCALTCNDGSNNALCKQYTQEARAFFASAAPSTGPGSAPTGTSGDKGTNCKENKGLCTNPVYREFMRDNCQETCKDASGIPSGTSSSDCTDKPHTK